ncbi:MAG: HlyC/CorC family transporter [Clostridiales bacterium]|nr:HlyC/CorC family transporter [Clostridiales bacterium]
MDPDPSPSIPLQLLLIFVLILINAFFAAAEMAIVSVNRNKMKALAAEGKKKAQMVLDFVDEPNSFLSSIQVAITLSGFLASASASMSMADDVGAWLTKLGVPWGTQIGVFLVTLILSYFTLVLGELYPKRLAMNHAEKVAMATVGIVNGVRVVTKPIVWFLSVSVKAVMKLTRQKETPDEDAFSEEEVVSMLEAGQESGALDEEGAKMITNIFDFDDTLAYEVMTPRPDVFTIDIQDDPKVYMDELMEMQYTRIPVYEEHRDRILGILNIKDYFIEAKKKGFENVDIRSILRKPFFVPETKNIADLMRELQASKQHIAILIDEYGGFSGIVTLEDIIEEVMGDIDDEYDEAETEITSLEEGTYRIEGSIALEDLNEELGLKLESETSETIGGYLLELLGEIPEDGENLQKEVEDDQCTYVLEVVKDRRIEQVKLTVKQAEEKEILEEE